MKSYIYCVVCTNGKYFDLAPFVFIKKKMQENYLYSYLLGVLNSKVVNVGCFWVVVACFWLRFWVDFACVVVGVAYAGFRAHFVVILILN